MRDLKFHKRYAILNIEIERPPKVEASKVKNYVFSDAPILLADRVGIFLLSIVPIYIGQQCDQERTG